MWTDLDPRTLLAVAVFVALIPGVIGVVLWKTRRNYPGRWVLGNVLAALCLILLSLRGRVPDFVSIVLANAAIVGADIAFLQGIRLFRGLRILIWPEWLWGTLALAGVIWFRYVSDDINARMLVMGFALGSMGLVCGVTLLKKMPVSQRFGAVVTGSVFVAGGIFNLFRGVYVFIYAPVTDMFEPSGSNTLFFLAASLGIVTRAFGFFDLTSERVEVRAPAPAEPAIAPSPVPDAEAREQLRRILESEGFRRSAQMERFLTQAVEQKLLGRVDELKEYALGRDVFNRGDDYDPRTDSIVRVEAQRLRRKLREYYEEQGSEDRVLMTLPAGTYVPVIEYRTPGVTSKRAASKSPARTTAKSHF